MSATTSIEWTDRSWNPVRGCSIVSPGCINCYAMKQAHRFSGPGRAYEGLTKQTTAGPQWTGVVRTIEAALLEPLSWRKPARIFVNSMSDLFHEDVPDAFIDRVFAVMALAPQHTFQILTKRAERMRDYISGWADMRGTIESVAIREGLEFYTIASPLEFESEVRRPWPLPNVWLGVSCENQEQADKRIPLLLKTPATVRWVSAEPLLGPIELTYRRSAGPLGGYVSFLDWVVVGGESGNGARPCDLAWVRSIVQQCKGASVPVFVKQLGADPFWGYADGTRLGDVVLKHRKGGNLTEWPSDLQVREWPRVEASVSHA